MDLWLFLVCDQRLARLQAPLNLTNLLDNVKYPSYNEVNRPAEKEEDTLTKHADRQPYASRRNKKGRTGIGSERI